MSSKTHKPAGISAVSHTEIQDIGTNTHAQLDIHAGATVSVHNFDAAGKAPPKAHASNHTDGTDDIQDATAGQKGLMTLAYAGKMDGIEAGAEVNNISDVNAADLTDGGETILHAHPGGMKIERVTLDIVGQAIPANTTYTALIPLSRADYTHGDLMIHNNQLAAVQINQRGSGFYKFTTSISDAQGNSFAVSVNMISLCVYYDRWQAGFAYRVDSKLSNATFNSVGAGQIQLTSIRINGSNLELVFSNVSVSWPGTLTVYIQADVWRAA